MNTNRFLSSDPGEGGDPVPPAEATQPSSPPPPAQPPAATIVQNATKSEREIQLETELERVNKEKRDREIRLSELEDENHQLKSARTITAPAVPEDSGRWRPFKL